MVTLTVDIGNSNVKTSVWDDNVLKEREVAADLDFNRLNEFIAKFSPRSIAGATVRGNDKKLREKLIQLTDAKVAILDKEMIIGMKERISYSLPIGADRVAAFIGAEKRFPGKSKLIVDAGTAITIDVADASGKFCGGNISLGLSKRIKTLSASTALLPEVTPDRMEPFFAHDTIGAISNGVINGITGEILYSLKKARQLYNTEIILLTGGDGCIFEKNLREEGVDVCFDPYLVERGLDFVACSNWQ